LQQNGVIIVAKRDIWRQIASIKRRQKVPKRQKKQHQQNKSLTQLQVVESVSYAESQNIASENVLSAVITRRHREGQKPWMMDV